LISLPEPDSGFSAPAVSSSNQKPIYVILGMHRSGTSLCSSIMSALGVDMADEKGEGTGNELGHWERWDIVALQDEILGFFNRAYYARTHDFPLPPAWWADPALQPVVGRLEQLIAEKIRHTDAFGFKDPRTAKLMPVWKRIFNRLDLKPKFVFCIRNPAQIAASLKARDGLDPSIGEYRCLDYIVESFRYSVDQDVLILDYDEWFEDPAATSQRLQTFLGLGKSLSDHDRILAVNHLIHDEMNRQGRAAVRARQPLVRSAYELLRQARTDATAHEKFRNFADQFVSFRQLLAPFELQLTSLQSAHDNIQAQLHAAQTANEELTGQNHALQQAVQEQASVREGADAARNAAEHTTSVVAGERDALKAALDQQNQAQLELQQTFTQRIAEQDAAAAARLEEIGTLRSTIASNDSVILDLQNQLQQERTKREEAEAALIAAREQSERRRMFLVPLRVWKVRN